MIDLKQAAAVALVTASAVGLWFAGTKLGMPQEATGPAVIALVGLIVGALKSYRGDGDGKPPPVVPPLPLLFLLLTSCAASAEATHLAQLGSCVDRFQTREEIDSCRADVERHWGRMPDGGRIVDGGGQ